MSLISQESDDDADNILIAKIDSVKDILSLLKTIHFRESAVFYASNNGMKITVEDVKCVQAIAYLGADMFQQYTLKEEVNFKVNLAVLLECLGMLNNNIQGSTTSMKMCYNGYGTPLSLILEENGVITDCRLKTMEPQDTLDFNFTNTNVVNKIIFKSECLKEAFSELDMSSDTLELLLSPDKPYFQMSTQGIAGSSHFQVPKESEVIEAFNCTRTQVHKYKLTFLKSSAKALAISQKISLRSDDRGFLCFQYMIKLEDGQTTFQEFYFVPDEEMVDR